MSTDQQTRRREARRRAIRRRRRLAAVVLLALVIAPIAAYAAFGRGGSEPRIVAGKTGGWRAGKVRPAPGPALPSPAQQARAAARIVRLGLPVYCAGNQGRYVALTLDDGPSNLTPQFNELLRAEKIRVTYFLVGANMSSDELSASARESASLGAVANHTWTHARLTELSEADVDSQVRRTSQAVRAKTRAPVLVFRPPFGAYTSSITRIVGSYGLVNVMWNTDSRDWAGLGWKDVAKNVLAGLEPGSIVLMHDTREETLKALRNVIIPELRRRKLKAVTLPELLALNPPSAEQLEADAQSGACLRGQHDG